MDFKNEIKKELKRILKREIKDAELEIPADSNFGDYAFPCFELAKSGKKPANEIASEICSKVKNRNFRAEIKGGYANFFVNSDKLVKEVFREIKLKKNKYGSSNIGKKKKIVVDYSHPNIAKPFGIGHLRSTVIGNSLCRILEFLGYKCIGVNHLGDWGTQFGKLIYAYKQWGDSKKLKENPIGHLYDLYVKFHKEEEINPDLTERGREWFAKLEKGDKEALKWWGKFRELSLKEFKKFYSILEIKFDYYTGESFYKKMLEKTIKQFSKISEISDNALIIAFEDMAPLILRKSDGATTYGTRELATYLYRIQKYKPEKIIYVVGTPQSLHFNQVFKALEKIGIRCKGVHVNFGHINFAEGKMSTRKGNIIFLEEVLDKSVELMKKIIADKNPNLADRDKIAKQVGIGAIVFNDLSTDRVKDAAFDWDKMLRLEGETGPYAMYTYARACSVLRKSGNYKTGKLVFSEDEIKIIKHLYKFSDAVIKAGKDYKPSYIARYLLDLCGMFNEFYQSKPILKAEKDVRNSRLEIASAVRQVLRNSLLLMGINAPERM